MEMFENDNSNVNAGFRLQYLEVLNWVHSIKFAGKLNPTDTMLY